MELFFWSLSVVVLKHVYFIVVVISLECFARASFLAAVLFLAEFGIADVKQVCECRGCLYVDTSGSGEGVVFHRMKHDGRGGSSARDIFWVSLEGLFDAFLDRDVGWEKVGCGSDVDTGFFSDCSPAEDARAFR